MRRVHLFLLVCGLAAAVSGQAEDGPPPDAAAPIPCAIGVPGAPACTASKKELQEAKSAFRRGLKVANSKHLDEAFLRFDEAARLVPMEVQYVTARELARGQLVYEHLERGNELLAAKQEVAALAEFRSALQLDPQNEFAQQRLKDVLGEWKPQADHTARVLEDSGEIRVRPVDERATFHYRGGARGLFDELSNAYGVQALVDEVVEDKRVRFEVQDVDFYTAMRLACQVTKTMWTPLDANQMLVTVGNQENHQAFDRM